MKLRIVSGRLKRRMISIPQNATDFRPTKDFVREAIASSISNLINSATVADICCGSGAFGIEMISRGASFCDFVESNRGRCDCLSKTLQNFDIDKSESAVYLSTVEKFLDKAIKKYDIIFYDPPYDDENLIAMVPKLFDLIEDGGVLIYERRFIKSHYDNTDFAPPDNFTAERKKYGHTELLIWKSGI